VRKAVIDVGSNSVLLLVEELHGDVWRFVHEETAVTALGEGVKTTGELSEKGMASTLGAIRRQSEVARAMGATEVRAAATMAARIATNRQEFLDRAARQGTPVEILSGEDEARLGFEAVAYDPHFEKYANLTIVDPGGHSTELLISAKQDGEWKTVFLHSFAVGTLGLKSDVLPNEVNGPQEIIAASLLIDEIIRAQYPPDNKGAGPVVVLGATGTNLVSVREGLTSWQPEKVHGAYLMFEEISRAVGWMMPMTDEERRAIPGMEIGREKTLHIGALILERFLHALHEEGCLVSVRGWRYAMLERGHPGGAGVSS
jgi:exopolyphosphatase / guanosine-5'-triphosphate,3'-diphosphate pyrophosphatase